MALTVQIYRLIENYDSINTDINDEEPGIYRYRLKSGDTYSGCTYEQALDILWEYDISYKDINTFDVLMEFDISESDKSCLQNNFWNGTHRPFWDESTNFAVIFNKNGLAFNPYSINLKHSGYSLCDFNGRLFINYKNSRSGNRSCWKGFRHTKHWGMLSRYPVVSQKEIEEQIYQSEKYIEIPKIKHSKNRRGFNSWDDYDNRHSEKGNCWKTKKIRKQYQKNRRNQDVGLLNREYVPIFDIADFEY